MKTNNLNQHVLIQLLNPGMYNESILNAVLKEVENTDTTELLSQRFNFQNLKPAVLPIQSEWVDKEFSDFFRNFSKTHSFELSNGTIYDINLYNLAHIVAQSKNKVAQEVASKITKALDKKIGQIKNKDAHLSSIMIRNKHCNVNVAISPEDFYAKNLTPSYFSTFDAFAVNIITNNKLMGIYDMIGDKKFKATFLKLIEENPERIADAVSLVNIASSNLAINLLADKALAPTLCRVPAIEKSFWKTLSSNTNTSREYSAIGQYLKVVNKEFNLAEKTALFNKLIELPYSNFQSALQGIQHQNSPLSLSVLEMSDYIEKKSVTLISKKPSKKTTYNTPEAQQIKNFAIFIFSMLKPQITATTKLEDSLKYIENCFNILENENVAQIYNAQSYGNAKNYMTETIQKFLKSPQLDLEAICKHETMLMRMVLIDTKIKKEAITVMLEKGYYFPATFNVGAKTYKLTGLKLSKENLIKNEKNLLGYNLSKAPAKDTPKFKI